MDSKEGAMPLSDDMLLSTFVNSFDYRTESSP